MAPGTSAWSLCIHGPAAIFQSLFYVRHCPLGFTWIIFSFKSPQKSQQDRYYHPGCTDEETEAQINSSGKLPRKKVWLESTASQVFNRYCYHLVCFCYYSKTKTGGGKNLFGLPIPHTAPHWWKAGQEPGDSKWSRCHRGMMLTGGLLTRRTISSLSYTPRTTCPRTAPPAVGWNL